MRFMLNKCPHVSHGPFSVSGVEIEQSRFEPELSSWLDLSEIYALGVLLPLDQILRINE